MERMPHQKDPLFEIGFGGLLKEENIADMPLEDSIYVLRLSAFKPLASGIFKRDLERFTLLTEAKTPLLEVGKDYVVAIDFTPDSVTAKLNGELFATYRAPKISQGLVSLQTSWHPVQLTNLKVIGSSNTATSQEFSGLIEIAK
jgi:hypothetical protein